ncbi:MAG: MerR family redox-sensitive transcriptional activator SoxR [Oceanospirillaceae bacterium]
MHLSATNLTKQFSVGELAHRSGVSISAIHFYERKKLIYSTRNSSNHRRYSRVILRILAIIRFAQNIGISLSEIESALSVLPNKSKMTQQDWEQLSMNWQAQLNKRIQRLTLLRNQMSECIGCGCLSLDKCKVVNPYDVLGKDNSGAYLLDAEAN